MPFRSRTSSEKLLNARRMRHNPTHAEALLWQRIRDKQLGLKARQQVPILGYIADFYFPQARLIVEVDGSSHDAAKLEYDGRRDCVMADHDISTLRFSNQDVFTKTESVLETIRHQLSIQTELLTIRNGRIIKKDKEKFKRGHAQLCDQARQRIAAMRKQRLAVLGNKTQFREGLTTLPSHPAQVIARTSGHREAARQSQ